MQRKNRILMRSGMALMTAIIMILVLGGIMGAVMSMTSETSRRTSDIYMHEQALLLTRGATEYALLAVSGHNHHPAGGPFVAGTDNCINRIDAQYPNAANPMFDINISLSYVGFGSIGAVDADCNDYIRTIDTPESNGSILMDVTVTSNNGLNLDEPIRYHRRTLQKM